MDVLNIILISISLVITAINILILISIFIRAHKRNRPIAIKIMSRANESMLSNIKRNAILALRCIAPDEDVKDVAIRLSIEECEMLSMLLQILMIRYDISVNGIKQIDKYAK